MLCPERHFRWLRSHPKGLRGGSDVAFAASHALFFLSNSTTGQRSDFLTISRTVCLLSPAPGGRSWLVKTQFSLFLVVLPRVALLAPSDVARASCRGDGGLFALSSLALAPGYFPDPPFFGLFAASMFFRDARCEIPTRGVLESAQYVSTQAEIQPLIARFIGRVIE